GELRGDRRLGVPAAVPAFSRAGDELKKPGSPIKTFGDDGILNYGRGFGSDEYAADSLRSPLGVRVRVRAGARHRDARSGEQVLPQDGRGDGRVRGEARPRAAG